MVHLALSSYWMRECWESVSQFFRAGADLGFRSYEVSGLRRDTFHDEIRPGQIDLVSFHSPAPPRRGVSGAKDIRYDDASQQAATRDLQALLRRLQLDPGLDLPGMQAVVLSGMRTYQELIPKNTETVHDH